MFAIAGFAEKSWEGVGFYKPSNCQNTGGTQEYERHWSSSKHEFILFSFSILFIIVYISFIKSLLFFSVWIY